MYRRQVRRRRAVLVLLVVACLVLISTHFSEGEGGPLHAVQNGVGAVLGPLEEGASQALKPARDLVNWFDETFDARGDNERLRAQVQELRSDLAETEDRLARGLETGRVGRLVDGSPLEAYETVPARVASRSASSWNQTLVINQGRNAGVEVDDAVITGDGLVGRVSGVSGGSARVTLLTHPESAVTATLLDGGPTGLVSPEVGNPRSLVLELIDSDEELDDGEILVTAGFSDGGLRSRFPPGIPVGEIRESRPAEQQVSQKVHIEPFADLSRIYHVTVLSEGSG